MLAKRYVHQNIHQLLIPFYLIRKQQTWEQKVRVSNPDHQILYLVFSIKYLRESVLKIFLYFCLILLPITTIWNVFSPITQSSKTQGNISLSLTQRVLYFLTKTGEWWFSGQFHCKGHLYCFQFFQERFNWKTHEPTKIWAGGKSITRRKQRRKYHKGGMQEQLVSWVGEEVDFLGSKFMGLTCGIIWGSPWRELQKYSPYPVLQGFYYFETHFLSMPLNMKP